MSNTYYKNSLCDVFTFWPSAPRSAAKKVEKHWGMKITEMTKDEHDSMLENNMTIHVIGRGSKDAENEEGLKFET